ncbi:hypothetical protein, partial [Mesomycoplasma hyorhinis]|uniref:hypothetical protein n=1 Tax=Mesomycoplasma hyorhinis TaxID=2100 RepID=UPI001C0498F7
MPSPAWQKIPGHPKELKFAAHNDVDIESLPYLRLLPPHPRVGLFQHPAPHPAPQGDRDIIITFEANKARIIG